MKRTDALVAVVVLALFALAFQGSRGLWEPDEGRYTNIATEMLRSGNFLVPALNDDHPHFTKPPLTYWAIAGGVALLGWNEWGARLPNALAFLFTVIAVWAIARRLMPDRARQAAVVYATLLLPYMAANVVTTDTLLTLWEAVAMFGFVAWWRRPQDHPGRWQRVLMWAGFGLAFLTKGPPGLLPALAAVVFLALAGGRRQVARLLYPPGLLVFAALGLSWYGILVWQRPELLGYFLKNELVNRIATAEHHRNAQWYGWLSVYLPTLLIGSLPWSAVVVRRLGRVRLIFRREWWRERLASDPGAVLLTLWVLLPFAIFALARSRLPLYVLPLFVPLSLLLARQLSPAWPPSRRTVALAALWMVALAGGRWAAARLPSDANARPLARAISSADPEHLHEIVFVDEHPYWALSLYLRAEVEMVSFGPEVSWWANSTLDEEIDERESATLFVLPRAKLDRFEGIVAERGLHAVVRGSHGGWVFTVLADADGDRWPRPEPADRN